MTPAAPGRRTLRYAVRTMTLDELTQFEREVRTLGLLAVHTMTLDEIHTRALTDTPTGAR